MFKLPGSLRLTYNAKYFNGTASRVFSGRLSSSNSCQFLSGKANGQRHSGAGAQGKEVCGNAGSFHPRQYCRSNPCPEDKPDREDRNSRLAGILLMGIGGLAAWKWLNSEENRLHAATVLSSEAGPERVIPNLPEYKADEVAQHSDPKTSVWVTFERGVYDVTEFVSKHPGGDRILMGAGGSLEPFWELYPVHKRSEVFEILEKYRIGNLALEDQIATVSDENDPFQNEPKRHPVLIPRSQKPFNGETPPALLTEKYFTPNELFYVRNHLPVPKVDAESYQLDIDGISLAGKSFTLKDLKKFPSHEITAVIQCGGNRRSDMGKQKPVLGLSWTGGAIGNALWTGVRLKDVLEAAGFTPEKYKENYSKLHVQFEGLDSDQSGECYGSSIPLSFLLDQEFQPLLAFEMNGEELPVDHGYPVRLILPGIVGSRSVKWLSRIVINDEESHSPWQRRDYKVFSPNVTLETVDFDSTPSIQHTPVNSYICSHSSGDLVDPKPVTLEGYAFSGAGRDIIRVEISTDQGKTWEVATLNSAAEEAEAYNSLKHSSSPTVPAKGTRQWGWRLWKADIDFSKFSNEVEIWVKAVDTGYNQQPETPLTNYNYKGLLSNSFHKVQLKIASSRPAGGSWWSSVWGGEDEKKSSQ